jgi:hypothetical protein
MVGQLAISGGADDEDGEGLHEREFRSREWGALSCTSSVAGKKTAVKSLV